MILAPLLMDLQTPAGAESWVCDLAFAATTAGQLSCCVREDALNGGAKNIQSGDDCNGDQCNDQTVFHHTLAAFVLEKVLHIRSS